MRSSYFSLFNSYLSYGLVAWGKANKIDIKRINSFMRRRKRFLVTYDGKEYSVHHSGQMYAIEKKDQKNQRYNHIGTLLREGR